LWLKVPTRCPADWRLFLVGLPALELDLGSIIGAHQYKPAAWSLMELMGMWDNGIVVIADGLRTVHFAYRGIVWRGSSGLGTLIPVGWM
jgi:hypothetical protein